MSVYLITRKKSDLNINAFEGDLLEVFEGDYPPSGKGYQNLNIIEIAGLTKQAIDPIINSLFNFETIKYFWKDTKSNNWYERKISPKTPFCVDTLTQLEIEKLANPIVSGPEKIGILSKLRCNVERFSENYTTLMPT